VLGCEGGSLPRRYGLAATSILAADAVTAGSRAVRADRTHNPDLRAVRGAQVLRLPVR
jgi:FAD/FMN-containing dehydrogenase